MQGEANHLTHIAILKYLFVLIDELLLKITSYHKHHKFFLTGTSSHNSEEMYGILSMSHQLRAVETGNISISIFKPNLKQEEESFSPEKRPSMSNFQDQKLPVNIQQFCTADSNDVVVDQKTEISPTTLTDEQMFTPNFVPSDKITLLDSIKNAIAEQFVTVKGKVHSLGTVKKITTKLNKTLDKQEGILIDPSGQMKILLWEDQVNSIETGETYIFKNLPVKDNQYKERYLNPPKGGNNYSIAVAESYQEQLPEAEVIPDTLVVAQQSICGVSNISKLKPCLICGNKVILKNDKLANCTKCRMTVKVESCIHDRQLKIHVLTSENKTVCISVFNSEIGLLFSLCKLDAQCTEDELLENLLELSEVQIQYDSITCKLVDITHL